MVPFEIDTVPSPTPVGEFLRSLHGNFSSVYAFRRYYNFCAPAHHFSPSHH